MSKFAGRISIALVLGTVSLVCGDEPKCECRVEATISGHHLPLLSQLPYVGHLFNALPPTCPGPCCAEEVDHVVINGQLPGVDAHRFGTFFDATNGQPMRGVVIVKRFDLQQCAGEECAASCAHAEAKQCTGGTCGLSTSVASASKCGCENCTCENCSCEAGSASSVAVGKPCNSSCSCQQVAGERLRRLAEKTAELAIDRAELAAALEAQEVIMELKSEMFETLAKSMVENAKLEAKLALHTEREELAKQVQALQLENARLQAHVELASHREEVTRQSTQLALENEKLKLRLAEVERQGAADQGVTRSARRKQALR